MLNGAAVAIPSTIAGGVAGFVAWFLTRNVPLAFVLAVIVGSVLGRWCYLQFKN